MKLNQLENIEHLDEAPQGIFKRMGLKTKSAFGSDVAKGQLQSGDAANKLKKEYMLFVGRMAGKVGTTKPTTDTLLAFLKSKGADTKAVAGMIDKELQALAPQQQEPVSNEPSAEPEKTEPEVGSDTELDKLKSQNSTDQNNPLKPGNNTTNMKQTDLGLDNPNDPQGDLFKSNPIPSMSTNNTTVTTKRKKTGGKIAGKTSMTKNAIRKRNSRKKPGDQLELLSMYSEQSQRYRKNFERIDWTLKEDQAYFDALEFMGVMEAEIPTKVLDKVLNSVAVDLTEPAAADVNAPQDDQQSGQDDQQSGADNAGTQKKGGGLLKGIGKAVGGVFDKAKDGVQSGLGDNPEDKQASKIFDPDDEKGTGQMRGTLNYQNISKEFPGIDPTMLRRSMSKSLQGQPLTKSEHETMSLAMTELVKKNPQDTVKVMNLFKQARQD